MKVVRKFGVFIASGRSEIVVENFDSATDLRAARKFKRDEKEKENRDST